MLRLVAANKEQNKTAVLCSYRGCTDELSQCRRAAPRRCPSPVGTTSSRQLSSRLLPTITTASALTINIQNNIKNYYCYYYCSALYIKLYNSTAAVDSISSPFRNQQQNMKVDYHHISPWVKTKLRHWTLVHNFARICWSIFEILYPSDSTVIYLLIYYEWSYNTYIVQEESANKVIRQRKMRNQVTHIVVYKHANTIRKN